MTCLDCVKRVEVKLWLPTEAAAFFKDVAEYSDDDYEYDFLVSLAGYVDYAFLQGVTPRADYVRKLLTQLANELRDGEAA